MDDERVIGLIRDGHQEAFEELVARYQKQTQFMAFRYIKDWDEAADITQNAFIRLYKFIDGSGEDILILPWLRRVVTNLCLDLQRSKKWWLFFRTPVRSIKRDNEDDEKTGDPFDAIGDERLSPEEKLEHKEMQENIEAIVERLPNQQKKIFMMKHFEGLKIREIAEHLNVSEGQIKSQLFRAVHTIRARLKTG